MAKFQIFTDSCSDLPLEDREKYHLDYCRMNVVIDGEEKVADLDWPEFSPEEFYGWLSAGRHLKTTHTTTITMKSDFMMHRHRKPGKQKKFYSNSAVLSCLKILFSCNLHLFPMFI